MKIMLFYSLFTYFYLWLLPSYSPIMFYDEKYDRKCDRFISMMIYDKLCRILCRKLCIILYCYVWRGFKKMGGAISSCNYIGGGVLKSGKYPQSSISLSDFPL